MTTISGVGGFRPPPPKPPSFDKLDGNADGALSLDEFKAAAPKGAGSSKSEELFKKIDTDGDGSISKAEDDAFRSKAEKAQQQLQSFLFDLQSAKTNATDETETESAFARFDSDSDGSVTQKEFLDALGTQSDRTNSLLNKLFEAIDTDSDGSISKEEASTFQKAVDQRRPPPPPPEQLTEASQAYGNGYRLGNSASTGTSYSQAA